MSMGHWRGSTLPHCPMLLNGGPHETGASAEGCQVPAHVASVDTLDHVQAPTVGNRDVRGDLKGRPI